MGGSGVRQGDGEDSTDMSDLPSYKTRTWHCFEVWSNKGQQLCGGCYQVHDKSLGTGRVVCSGGLPQLVENQQGRKSQILVFWGIVSEDSVV